MSPAARPGTTSSTKKRAGIEVQILRRVSSSNSEGAGGAAMTFDWTPEG